MQRKVRGGKKNGCCKWGRTWGYIAPGDTMLGPGDKLSDLSFLSPYPVGLN